MKKIVLILLTLSLCIGAGAQIKRHEVNFGGGLSAHPDKLFEQYFPKLNSSSVDLHDLYEPLYKDVYYSPIAVIEYDYNFLPWLKAGLTADYFAMWGKRYYVYNGEEDGLKSVHAISLLPHVKFNAISNDHFKLYGGLGCGAGILLSNDAGAKSTNVEFVYEFVPVGIEFGGEFVYGITEITITNLFFGLRAGVGFRF